MVLVAFFVSVIITLVIVRVAAQSCSIGVECSIHTTSADVVNGKCVCTCRNSWSGTKCDFCDTSKYNQSQDCGECLWPRGHYPDCLPGSCSSAADCYGRAKNDPGGNRSTTGCDACECSNAWQGFHCETCPPLVNITQKCGICIDGYDGIAPNCYRVCNESDCFSHTLPGGWSGNIGDGCKCLCRNKWQDKLCDKCKTGWDANRDCNACAPGWIGTNCDVRVCSLIADCYDHATAVSGDYATGCVCTCANHWTLKNCSSCPVGFDATTNCSKCLPGYGPEGECRPACTAASCSNHAATFSGYEPDCVCNCNNAWSEKYCSYCAPRFTGANCDSCASGYENYKNCYFT